MRTGLLSLAILSSQFIIDQLEDRIIIHNLTNTLISELRGSANQEDIGLSPMASTPKKAGWLRRFNLLLCSD